VLVGCLILTSPVIEGLLAWQRQRPLARRARLVNETLAAIPDPHERIEALARFENNAPPTQLTPPQPLDPLDPDPPEP
jgi:hypothetical protein